MTRLMEWVVFFLLIVTAAGLYEIFFRQKDSLEPGQPAPDFRLADQHGTIHTLTDFRGKWLALYFYPKDDTPGCTKQACTFRDGLQDLIDLGAAVVGISVDDTNSHADFAKKYQLQFPLLADTTAETAARYHSLINLGMIKFARRNTFLIDPQGKIAHVYLSASPTRNSGEVFRDLKQAQGA